MLKHVATPRHPLGPFFGLVLETTGSETCIAMPLHLKMDGNLFQQTKKPADEDSFWIFDCCGEWEIWWLLVDLGPLSLLICAIPGNATLAPLSGKEL